MILELFLALSLQLPAAPEVPTAVVNIPRLVAESILGKAAADQLKGFQSEKQKVLTDKQAEVQQLTASKALSSQIERAQVELQRLAQDAEAELADLDRQLQADFTERLRPMVARIAEEDHIGIICEYPHQMIAWAASSVDITSKVIERLDAASREEKP